MLFNCRCLDVFRRQSLRVPNLPGVVTSGQVAGVKAVLLQNAHGVVGPLTSGAINPDRTVVGNLREPLAQLIEGDVDGVVN